MGNGLSTTAGLTATGPSRSTTTPDFLGELGGEVQYEKSMGTSRFLKTIRGRHQHGALVVKVFIKPDPSLSLKSIHRRLKAEREALVDGPNVLAYQRVLETERAGYLIRQWVASNLYDRISTRPFLSSIEKRWIAFQLLTGLKYARERNIAHGDIKTENVVVTSWNWVYLTDFASFKPTYLPLDDPSAFSFFFDTSSRRTCYLAPERFYAAGSDMAKRKDKLEFGKRDGKVTEAMDVFGLGCVLAELWMEGTPPFTLSQMFKYREGQYSPEPYLEEIEDPDTRALIRSMISLDPADRLTCDEYLSTYRTTAFPDIFYTFLHPFISSLNEASNSSATPSSATPTGLRSATGTSTPSLGVTVEAAALGGVTMQTDADDNIEKVWSEWEMIARYLDEGRERKEDRRPESAQTSKAGRSDVPLFPIRLHVPGLEGAIAEGGAETDGPALVLLALVCSNIRNCARPASIIRALDVLLALSRYLTDETKLDRLVPYLVAVLQDDNAGVRSAALKTLTQTLMLISTISPSNSAVFTEYIFPNTRPFTTDPEVLPRIAYAQCISFLADTAARFLQMSEAMKTEGTFKLANLHEFDGSPYEAGYDASLQELQSQVQEHVNPLLSDSSTTVKRALLCHVGALCTFFGRLKANDAILAHLVTYLNTRDWLLRVAWNENAVDVASCVGSRSLEEYILPLITLSLADAEEFVVAQVLASLTTLADRRLLAKGKIWELVAQITGFLCHPNIWIREGAAAFLSTVAKLLQPTDRWCILYPTVKRLLRADVTEMTELSLLDNAREPISRVIFEAAVVWAGRSGKSNFWSFNRAPTKGAPRDASIRTDEDNAQLEKMRQLGMKPEDEYKLSAMREYISKLAVARQSSPSRLNAQSDSMSQPGGAALQDLGIVPQTIFFSIRSAEEVAEANREAHHLQYPEAHPRRFSFDTSRSATSVDGRSNRLGSAQPVDDLRRRLALVSTAAAPVGLPPSGLGAALPIFPSSQAPSIDITSVSLSALSNSSTDDLSDHPVTPRTAMAKSKSRVHGKGVEVGKVAPAIGQDSTNVMGLFNVDARYRGDEDAVSAITHAVTGTPMGKNMSETGLAAQRFVSTYEGNDASIKQLLERVYLDSYRDPLPELGPPVPIGIPRRKALRTSFPPRERTPSRPEGTLIAHLVEHTAAITSIQVSPDQLFFATGSEDGTVKIWDTIRLEKNVTSRARQTFVQGGKITSVCVLENSHCVASASDNGTLWIHRVDVTLSGSMPRYSKPHLIRQQSGDGEGDFVTCLASYNTETTTNLLLGTSLSTMKVLDIRTMRNLHTFTNPTALGPITSICLDRKRVWFVVGTASGHLSLWDLRFGLLLRSWKVGTQRIHKISVHPGKEKEKSRWIIVAVENEERGEEARRRGSVVAQVWDIDRGVKVEEFRVLAPGSAPIRIVNSSAEDGVGMKESKVDAASAISALLASHSSNTPAPSPSSLTFPTALPESQLSLEPGVRAFLVGSDYSSNGDGGAERLRAHSGEVMPQDLKSAGGYLITGGEDRKVRYWDLSKSERSAVVSGLDIDDERPVYTMHTSSARPTLYLESPPPSRSRPSQTSSSAYKVHRSTHIANSQQQLLRGHREAITALAVIDLPFRCLVSGDRSGVIKVFE